MNKLFDILVLKSNFTEINILPGNCCRVNIPQLRNNKNIEISFSLYPILLAIYFYLVCRLKSLAIKRLLINHEFLLWYTFFCCFMEIIWNY